MFKIRIKKLEFRKEKLKNRKRIKKLEQAVFDPNFVRIGAPYGFPFAVNILVCALTHLLSL